VEKTREIHPHFLGVLRFKSQELIDLYLDLRTYLLLEFPDSNELLYHTHALTSLYTVSEKMTDAFCMISVYTEHLNLGFNKGTLLKDPTQLLQGTGKLIRHIPIKRIEDFRNDHVKELLSDAYSLAMEDLHKESKVKGVTISKIK
tara:strand:+ start:2610 stop:3044 length:435 start_codon:yes stop_codon:yes gene_type:complete